MQGSLRQTTVTKQGPVVVEGTAIGSDAAAGTVRVIDDVADIATMQEGEVLVADITDRTFINRASCVTSSSSLGLCV